LFVRAQWKEG